MPARRRRVLYGEEGKRDTLFWGLDFPTLLSAIRALEANYEIFLWVLFSDTPYPKTLF